MQKLAVIGLLALSLSGCEAVRTIAPQTTAGFEANGIIGAIDGASGAILAKCKTLDGEVIRVSVDNVAGVAGKGDLVDRVRAARQRACQAAGKVNRFVDEPVGEEPQEVIVTGETALNAEPAPEGSTDTTN